MTKNFSLIYKNRFEPQDLKFRNEIWKVLCSDFFQKFIKKSDTVLDIACGYGEFVNNIKAGKKIAIDLNPDTASHLNRNITFKKASSVKIPLPKNSVDKIFVSNFFEHLTRNEIDKTILEFKRILKNGGKIIVLQPNIRFCTKDYWMFFDHVTPIDDRALDEAFSLHGFSVDGKIERFLPFSTKSRFPKSTFLVRAYLRISVIWRLLGKQSLIIYAAM